MRKILFIILVMAVAMLQAKENRWLVNGNHSVQWETSKGELPYNDHIEMSGLRASVVYYWGVDATLRRGFPQGHDGQQTRHESAAG